MIKITKLFLMSASLSLCALNAADSTREIESLRTSLRRAKCGSTACNYTTVAGFVGGASGLIPIGASFCVYSSIGANPLNIAGMSIIGCGILTFCSAKISADFLSNRGKRIEKQLSMLTQEPLAEQMETPPSYETIIIQPRVTMPIFLPPSYEESSYQNQ